MAPACAALQSAYARVIVPMCLSDGSLVDPGLSCGPLQYMHHESLHMYTSLYVLRHEC